MILTNFDNKRISEIKLFYKNEFDNTIDEYFDYLEAIRFGFLYFTARSYIRKLNNKWHSPFKITHAIKDINNSQL